MSHPPAERIPVVVPDLGADGQPLSISAWYVEVGDEVTVGDPLLEVLLPGITCDIAAPVSGEVVRIEKDVDARTQTGEVLAWIIPQSAEADSDPADAIE